MDEKRRKKKQKKKKQGGEELNIEYNGDGTRVDYFFSIIVFFFLFLLWIVLVPIFVVLLFDILEINYLNYECFKKMLCKFAVDAFL